MSDNPNISDPNYVDWSDDDLDALANVTPSVLADARADALRADAELGALLEAAPDND